MAAGHPLPALAFHVARDRRSGALRAGEPLTPGYLHHLAERWRFPVSPQEFAAALRHARGDRPGTTPA